MNDAIMFGVKKYNKPIILKQEYGIFTYTNRSECI